MSEPVVKTAQDAIEALRTVVAGREFFVYEAPEYTGGTCVNFATDEEDPEVYRPSCVVGHVLALWGLEPELFASFRSGGVTALRRNLSDAGHWLALDDGATDILHVAQYAQDDRFTWGESLKRAERTRAFQMEYEVQALRGDEAY